MRVRNFKYFIGQGFGGLASNSMMSFASISIVTASIAIFGIFILFGINLNYISEQMVDGLEMRVFIERGTSENVVQNIGRQLQQIEGVREVVEYTPEEQLQDAREAWANEPDMLILLGSDDVNFFRDGFRVFLDEPEYAEAVEVEIRKLQNISNVRNDIEYMQWLVEGADTLRVISFLLVLLLGLVSIFIISNTIKLAMFSRRREISIMRFVGATNWFIRWPFVIEGLIIGGIGGLVASGLILWGYGAAVSRLNEYVDMIEMAGVADVYGAVILSLVLLGGGIGLVGSTLSIRKYLFA